MRPPSLVGVVYIEHFIVTNYCRNDLCRSVLLVNLKTRTRRVLNSYGVDEIRSQVASLTLRARDPASPCSPFVRYGLHSNSHKGPAFESRRNTKQLVLLDTSCKLKNIPFGMFLNLHGVCSFPNTMLIFHLVKSISTHLIILSLICISTLKPLNAKNENVSLYE